MTEIIDLRPNKSLINSTFEKYQFSNEAVPIISENKLKNHVYRLEPNQNQESWLEARLFAFHNHLFNNVYDTSCWFIDETWAVWRLDEDSSLDQVYELHVDAQSSKVIVTMCAIVADDSQKKYTQLVLLSYSLCTEDGATKVHNIDKQILKVQGTVDYACVEENGDYLHSICQDNISFENDNVGVENAQVSEIRSEHPGVSSQIRIPKYYWSQDEDSLTVWVKVPKDRSDKRPRISVKPLELSVTIDDETLIQGECQHRLEENVATWRHKEGALQVELSKHESGLMWSELIKGDTGGECLPNEVLAAEIHTRLAHLCTDQQDNNAGGDQPCVGFNAEQLEECDLEGKDNFLQRINFLTRTTTHLARLGSNNHVLFTYKGKHGQTVCLRYDHDACIWRIGDGDAQWSLRHVLSFPGFGYVEASKTNKKFCVSPIDGSYIAIVEHTRHVFLYERPAVGAKSAKQRIVDLDCQASPIMGVVATNKYLIVLSKEKLYRLQIHT
ncbi:PREDICTED: nudC domain-containing protein 1 isoform X2 [Vollenhovia emeryi]|uniref:nudC domain-containing protein 1 isoform X2 n=1 Tax=Vollenhovia emeryi TaxID=411798 RepID=UPI0005F464FC|nr:PREDICTED: nudC domain-containing protein 1 isoform X2 [Vollenhovia emeryi]